MAYAARQFITFTTRPGPRWAVLPGWTEFRPMGCRDGFSIVFETGWELFHVASEYENCIELSVQHHAASHPKESWLQKICLFHPFSSLFILFYAWFVANLSLGPSLHRERPLLRSCGWSFASLQLPFHSDTLVSVSRCRKSPIMLHRVMFLLLGRMAPCFFYLEEWRLKSPIDIHLNSPWMLRLRAVSWTGWPWHHQIPERRTGVWASGRPGRPRRPMGPTQAACSHAMNCSKAGDQSGGHSSGDLSVPDPKNTRFLEV